jgi:hypothetical protein
MRRLKRSEPSITEDIKQAKIMPNGRFLVCEADLRAGDQKNTNKYMLPSTEARMSTYDLAEERRKAEDLSREPSPVLELKTPGTSKGTYQRSKTQYSMSRYAYL